MFCGCRDYLITDQLPLSRSQCEGWASCHPFRALSSSPNKEYLWILGGITCTRDRFSKVPRTFRARKAIRKTTTSLFCKTGLLICCKGNKSKNKCKVSCLETPSFWRYKENYVTRNTPEKFHNFRETGPWAFRKKIVTTEWSEMAQGKGPEPVE